MKKEIFTHYFLLISLLDSFCSIFIIRSLQLFHCSHHLWSLCSLPVLHWLFDQNDFLQPPYHHQNDHLSHYNFHFIILFAKTIFHSPYDLFSKVKFCVKLILCVLWCSIWNVPTECLPASPNKIPTLPLIDNFVLHILLWLVVINICPKFCNKVKMLFFPCPKMLKWAHLSCL